MYNIRHHTEHGRQLIPANQIVGGDPIEDRIWNSIQSASRVRESLQRLGLFKTNIQMATEKGATNEKPVNKTRRHN